MHGFGNGLVLVLSVHILQMGIVNSKLYSKLIGFYSICSNGTTAATTADENNSVENNNNHNRTQNNHNSDQTNLTREAYLTNKTIYNQIFHGGRWSTPNKGTRQIEFEYISLDVCYNETRLTEIILNLLLDESYFHQRQPHQPVCTSPVSCLVPNIAMLVAYVPERFSKLIRALTTNIAALSGFLKLCQPMTCGEVENDPEIAYTTLPNSLLELNWTNVFCLHLSAENAYSNTYPIFKETYKYTVETRQFDSKALELGVRNETELQHYLYTIGEVCGSENRALVIITGHELSTKVLRLISNSTTYRDLNILMYNYFTWEDNENDNTPDNWLNLENGAALDIFDRRYADFNAHNLSDIIAIFFIYFKMEITFRCDRMTKCATTATKEIYKSAWNSMDPYFEQQYSLGTLKDNKRVGNITVKPSKQAPLHCGPGHHKQFISSESLLASSLTTSTPPLYSRADSTRCVLCPANHYKIHWGDNKCEKCMHPTSADNGERTGCVDPFTNVTVQLARTQRAILASLATLGVLLNSAILVIFYMKQDTPLVKTSDMCISCTQLLVLLLLHVGTISVYVDTALNLTKCIARNLLLTVLYAANIGLVFTKSQKMMGAYLSKIRVSRSSIRRTNTAQIFTVFLFVFISNCLLGILYVQQAPIIGSVLDHVTMRRVHFCVTSSNDDVVGGLLITGQLACLVQAFRARNLPSVMNDSMSVLYAVFVSTVTMAISYPIMHFQPRQSDQDFVRYIVVLLNSFVYVLLLYGKRFVLIVFLPQRNTKSYFFEKCREQVFSKSGLKNQ